MSSLQHIELENRGILSIGGPEASEFLQGLITNNILNVDRDTSIYAALLTPQGKFLHDFFIVKKDGCYLLAEMMLLLKHYQLSPKIQVNFQKSRENPLFDLFYVIMIG